MELPSDIEACHELIKAQSAQSGQLLAIISELDQLKQRLNQDSHNSNKPPSSDGLHKRIAQSCMPKKRNLKRGGQKCHKGKALDMISLSDEVHSLYFSVCSCGNLFSEQERTSALLKEKRQVCDLPEPKLAVTEYQQFTCSCLRCTKQVSVVFPNVVSACVQYGIGVKSLAVLLNIGYYLPYKKIKELFRDLFGYQINEPTLCSANKLCYTALESSEELIKQKLRDQQVAHLDETGIRTEGKLHWLQVCSSKLFTYLFVHQKRGNQALDSTKSLIGILDQFVIHDCWKSYFKYGQVQHGLCGAHSLREFLSFEEQGYLWEKWFSHYLLTLYQLIDKQQTCLTDEQQQKVRVLFERIWQNVSRLEPKPKKPSNKRDRPKSTVRRSLLNRFKGHQEAVLAEQVSFINNQAERDLRPFKIKLKVSNCFRTLNGVQIQARVFGFISTLRKHQVNIFKEPQNTFIGNNFIISTYGAK